MTRPLTIYIIAGEVSGDRLGAGVMQELKRRHGEKIVFHGVGGEKMQAEGLKSHFPYDELSVMGFAEILPKLIHLRSRIDSTIDDAVNKAPDMVVTIDSPGFNFRVVEGIRKQKHQIKTFIHIVAPTVWAYKPERAAKCAELFDHMLVLLPFEPPYFTKEGLDCTYIGHPVAWNDNPKGDGAAFRRKYDISEDAPLFCLLPGSRRGEIKRHMPIFAATMLMLGEAHPNLALVVPVHPGLADDVALLFHGCPFRAIILPNEEEKMDAIASADVALVKSGTVTLDVAYAGTPMIVTYRVHPLTAWMVRKWIGISQVCLINIIEKTAVIPEFLQEDATPYNLANSLAHLLTSETQRNTQKMHMQQAIAKLQPPGGEHPHVMAAREILNRLKTEG